MPSPDVIADLERALPRYVREHAPERGPDLADKLSSYRRQYAGFVRQGKMVVYVNFFPDETRYDDWRRTVVIGCDGGLMFWSIEYEVASSTFSDLQHNGAIEWFE